MAAARGRSRKPGGIRVLLLAAVLGIVAAFGLMAYRYLNATVEKAPDYVGDGTGTVLLHVMPGDTIGVVGDRLYDLGVVKSARAFTSEVSGTKVEGLQPGYYQVRKQMSGGSAVDLLADPNTRVGFIDIKPGQRLRDTKVVGGRPEKGIYTQISEATCLRDLDNPSAPARCRSPQEIEQVAASVPPQELGVPEWALGAVSAAPDPAKRLEGLIVAGVHNVDPNAEPVAILRQLVSESAAAYEQTGLSQMGRAGGLNPYQTLVAASLVEKEGQPEDFAKVARVVLNRLAAPMRLQFDSTVNYTVADQEVATTDADRGARTPWNTYASDGLPYGPIDSPSLEALKAVEHPEDGPWLYFVTVDKQGTTKFTADYAEHQRFQKESIDNGVLASGR